MARSVSSANFLSFGSDASIDGFVSTTSCGHGEFSTAAGGLQQVLGKNQGASQWTFRVQRDGTLEANAHVRLIQNFDGLNDGDWDSNNNSVQLNTPQSVAAVYSKSGTGNNPTFYIEGSVATENELLPPLGSAVSDAADDLEAGSTSSGTYTLGHIIYDNSLFSSAAINRWHWWGMAPGGPSTVDVLHPMWTDETTNKGTATADMTFPGGTPSMTNLPRVQRPTIGAGMVGF